MPCAGVLLHGPGVMTAKGNNHSDESLHGGRMRRFQDAGLYLVTSESLSRGRGTIGIMKAALDAGARLFQLREKSLCARDLADLASRARRLTDEYDALLLINDRLDIAMAVGADGVHLGRDDLPIDVARGLAPGLIIGASSHSMSEALEAEAKGASYVNIGPVYPTKSKEWGGDFLGAGAVERIGRSLRIPFTVMGGITAERIPELAAAGARVMAVITAVTAQPDPGRAAREMLEIVRKETSSRLD